MTTKPKILNNGPLIIGVVIVALTTIMTFGWVSFNLLDKRYVSREEMLREVQLLVTDVRLREVRDDISDDMDSLERRLDIRLGRIETMLDARLPPPGRPRTIEYEPVTSTTLYDLLPEVLP